MYQIYETRKPKLLVSYIGHGQSFGPNNPGGPPTTAAAAPARLLPLASALPWPLPLPPPPPPAPPTPAGRAAPQRLQTPRKAKFTLPQQS